MTEAECDAAINKAGIIKRIRRDLDDLDLVQKDLDSTQSRSIDLGSFSQVPLDVIRDSVARWVLSQRAKLQKELEDL